MKSFSSVKNKLTNVTKIVCSFGAMMALKEDGTVVVWGDSG